jgi:hypothetical protein
MRAVVIGSQRSIASLRDPFPTRVRAPILLVTQTAATGVENARFGAFGDPSVLYLAEVADPAAGEATALVRVMASSINLSDAKNVAGAMKQTTLPRIPVATTPACLNPARPSGLAPRVGNGRRYRLHPR